MTGAQAPPWRRAGSTALAVAVTLVLAGACASAPGRPRLAGAGPLRYWTRPRLLGARPWPGLGIRRGPPSGRPASARSAVLAPRVGALFVHQAGGDHFCTASVVASPGKDLLITAAHCINAGQAGGGYRQDIVFVPAYRDGQAPFGVWTVKRLLVAPGWRSDSDPRLDVGFVALEPHDGQNIQDVLGADRLGLDSRYQYLVRVTGYPSSGGAPITCINWTSRQSAAQLRFECGGFTGGTSGSPWVTRFAPRTRTGTIVGVIGGYQEGGDSAAVSYSSYLGRAIQRLYRRAVAAEAPG